MGKKKEDSTIISIILGHLPDEYQTVKTASRHAARKGKLDLDDLLEDVQSFYRVELSDQKIYEFGTNPDNKKEEKALVMNSENNNNNNNNNVSKKKNGTKCDYCGKIGHIAKYCFNNPNGENFKGEDRTKNNSNNRNNRGSNKTNNDRKKEIKCYNCGGIGHIASKCPSEKQNNKDNDDKKPSNTETSMFCGMVQLSNRVTTTTEEGKWLFDNGATKHMTNDIKSVSYTHLTLPTIA